MASTGALLVFTREPVPGHTKTRLIPDVGSVVAAQIHYRLLERTLDEASNSNFTAIQIWSYPNIHYVSIKYLAEQHDLSVHRQFGNNLGERMFNALDSALKEHDFAVIVGSDCPVINTTIYNQAFEVLVNGYEAVLGSCEDGGYYLIGSKKADYKIFSDISWGEKNVVEITRKRFKKTGIKWFETEQLWDVDEIGDVNRLKSMGSTLLEDLIQTTTL